MDARSSVINSITNYSQTQRIVLLIDINPLLYFQNPNLYITTLLSISKTLISFPQFSNSLFSFKPFFSSLSPLLSSSKLSFSHSFDRPTATLHSLTQFLNSILTTFDKSSIPLPSHSKAKYLSASLRQVVHDYSWDPIDDFDCFSDCNSSFVKPNLVILFSPIVRSFSEFFDVEFCDFSDGFVIDKFCEVFVSVNDTFVCKDIHFSWVDVKCEVGCNVDDFEKSRVFTSAIRGLGWSFCSSDCIALGSALIPFGLIYPRIGVSSKLFSFDDSRFKGVRAQLNLEILDVNGKPLDCKYCDLELVHLKILSSINSKLVWDDYRDGVVKIHVKAVQKVDKYVKFKGFVSDPVVVREFSGDRKEDSGELFEDRVLQILHMEMGEMVPRKSVPFLQILLSFLYREDYWALVSLSNSYGKSLTGVLRPFTVSLALLSIVDGQFYANSDVNLARSHQLVMNKVSVCLPGSRSGSLPVEKPGEVGDDKRKKDKKRLSVLQDMTWSTFCQAALERSDLDLEDVCFARGCSKSKKLKFMKCWMKQIPKTSNCNLTEPERSKPQEGIPKEIDRLNLLHQECEQPIASCSSMGEDSLTGASRIQDEAAAGFCSESSESFLNNIPRKIQQGLESEEVDLASLANRLVKSSICWLYQKYESETMSESQTHIVKSDDPSSSLVAVELTKLLLKDPKDMVTTHRNVDLSSKTSTEVAPENTVREYELQILFRMEILQSEVGACFRESTKQKFVKQICLLLENIQCHLQGGFFGDWSLDKYVKKIINSRYSLILGDVVQKIYERMDLLLFEDEEEFNSGLLNSEDSSLSSREKHKKEDIDENCRDSNPVSAEADETLERIESEHQSPQEMNQKEHARKLIEAEERRRRARRFASFTSWVPDLQRVWAPKQLSKAMKATSDHSRKQSKRKGKGRISYDRVCETPLTGLKRSCSRGDSSSSEKDCKDTGIPLCGSVSKALFQDY